MTVDAIEKELSQGKLASLYLLYGEEQYLLDSSLKKIKKLFGEQIRGINYIKIDETNVNSLISELETPAFGYNKKMIIAKNTGLFKKESKRKKDVNQEYSKKVAEYLNENINNIKDSIVLIFVEEEAEKNELFTVLEKNGNVCNFAELKPYEIEARLKHICSLYKVTITSDVTKYLIECCGTNMQDLINEIRKLIEYSGEGGQVTKKAIDLLCIKQMDSIIFDLTDNLGKKNIKEALEVLNNLIYAKEPIQKILITLYNHFKKLYITKLAITEKIDVIESLKLKPNQTFLVAKYKTQAGYFKEQELRSLLEELILLDRNYKVGLIDINIGLESILCRYCQ